MKTHLRYDLSGLCKAVATAGLFAFAPMPSFAFDLTRPANSFEEERSKSESLHAEVLSQFGGAYDDAELAAYVERVGQRVAAASEMPDRPFVFTVLNSPVVNAFTTGGGYVYVTRGILSRINSEAELAALLGHEIGHVTARHTARRETRMKHDRAAAVGLGLLTGSLSTALIADGASNVLRQAYSRKQEAESDRLGVVSMTAAGYDPSAMPAMLSALNREGALLQLMAGDSKGRASPAWLSDHPETDDRIHDTQRQIKIQNLLRGEGEALEIGHDAHLDAIDGIMFGADPNDGLMIGRTYVHPEVGVRFDLPQGYRLQDMSGALVAEGPDESVVIFSAGRWPEDRKLSDFSLTAWRTISEGDFGQLDSLRQGTINGLETVIASKSVSTRLGEAFAVSATFRLQGDIVAGATLLTKEQPSQVQVAGFDAILGSIHALSDEDRDAIPNPQIAVKTVEQGQTIDSFAELMLPKTFKKERLQALNGIGDTVAPGDRLKLVIDAD